jgi:hypothetical protein
MKLLQSHHLLALASALLFLLSFLITGDQTVDIHFHDTYFVIDGATFIRSLGTLLLICWGIYLVTNRILLSRWLTWIHIMMTLVAITMATPFSLFTSNKYESWRYMVSGMPTPRFVIIFIIAQATLIINIAGGIIKQAVKDKDRRTAL